MFPPQTLYGVVKPDTPSNNEDKHWEVKGKYLVCRQMVGENQHHDVPKVRCEMIQLHWKIDFKVCIWYRIGRFTNYFLLCTKIILNLKNGITYLTRKQKNQKIIITNCPWSIAMKEWLKTLFWIQGRQIYKFDFLTHNQKNEKINITKQCPKSGVKWFNCIERLTPNKYQTWIL